MAEDSRLSSVIDEEGKLFGVVNVIDALVVLFAVAIVVAGLALVVPSGGDETRYATIELGPQPAYTAEQISTGDEWETSGGSLQITDVYMFPTDSDEGDVSVIVRAAVNGTAIETEDDEASETIQFAGEPLRYGQELEIQTNEYVVGGTVTRIDESGESLSVESETFVLETEIDSSTAAEVSVGDEYRVGDRALLTVESLTVYATGEEETRRLVLGVTAEARQDGETALFGDRPLRSGSTVPIQTGSYALSGSVVATGTLEEPGTPATREVTVEVEGLSPSRASAIDVGAVEEIRSTQTAEVVSVDDRPAETVIESGDGFDIVEHPRDRDLTLTVELAVQEREDGTIGFRSEQLRIGEDLTFELTGTTVTGEVTAIDE